MSQIAALRVFESRERYLERARAIAAAGAAIVTSWIASRDDVSWVAPAGGICAFLRLHRVPNTAEFSERLFRERGVAIAEGELFERPGWARIAFGGPEEELREGLALLGDALDAYR